MPKVDFRSIGREIKKVQKSIKSTRSRAAAEQKSRLDDLIRTLDVLHQQTVDGCPKSMAGEVVALKKTGTKAAKSKRRTR